MNTFLPGGPGLSRIEVHLSVLLLFTLIVANSNDVNLKYTCKLQVWPQGYKTFFMLNSAEHEIFSANKYENANNS